ncbi:LysR family transcriptional regulator [Pseudoalteromonas sp. SMS1]|uniref:LysR family transcriptional regulator n=1 Tax=Pseudoalteromonas sp. SMS1 TaxID=2908894 RepID=UPI001F1EF2B8|nr:LysR family transcriptional regulator [Pseudoalteromonas sp. SMS1]MCF2859208.1 LysR family transcriptional regulator [Pseudoalteromonas sp. SMS1]
MNKWTEVKTAYRLGKLGTLSATAEDLGIHRSTVMRHIDALEATLSVKLFQRNDRGYIPTEAGLEVMRLGEVTDIQFTQFANKASSAECELAGKLSITCVSELAPMLMPLIMEYQALFPKMQVDILGDIRKFALEYGEADVAIRMGPRPDTPDNIVFEFAQIELKLCAHVDYIERFGTPNKSNITEHKFIALNERVAHLPWNEWIYNHIPPQQIVLTSSVGQVLNYALHHGFGIGVSTKETITNTPTLIEIDIAQQWQVNAWMLVHRDMLNIPKVRAFIDLVKRNPLHLALNM